MKDPRTVCWFSRGAASAVATRIILREQGGDGVVIATCDTGSEHEDSNRFEADCVRWFNAPVVHLKNERYRDTWHVWEKERYLSGINGAKCTKVLKVEPRLDFQSPHDIHVFGYTSDKLDCARALRLSENYPELTFRFPLIEQGIDKSACLSIVKAAGIKLPILYGLGFPNNNCIPCVKSQSPAYWALVRLRFPEQFERMVKLSRELNVRLVKIKGERRFIDEIPADQSVTDPIVPTCDFLCAAMSADLDAAA